MKNGYVFYCLVTGLLMFPAQLSGQKNILLSGRVISTDGYPVAAASVVLKNGYDSTGIAFCISSQEGSFVLKVNIEKPGTYFLQVTHIGYQGEIKEILPDADPGISDYFFFRLKPLHSVLREVVVTTKLPSITVKQDTLEFNALAFQTPETIKLEDLLKNIRGFAIDGKGRITYNGKELEKILIEGDDLAGKNYTLLSKYLSASVVDKVQVLNNYNDKRLLKDIERSGKIAINIVVGEKMKNKVSGTLAAAGSLEKRYLADANIIYLSHKIKSLVFSNGNNTGDSPDADVQYYFNEEGTRRSNDQNEPGIVKPGSINVPNMDDKYIKNNADIGNNVMHAWKIGNAVKMRALAGYNTHSLSNRSAGHAEIIIPGVAGWVTETAENSAVKAKSFLTQISIDHDHLKKNTGSWSVSLSTRNDLKSYKNIASVAVADTLSELLHNRVSGFRFNGYETFRLPKNLVLTGETGFSRDHIEQDFNSVTNRFLQYFKTDSLFSDNEQNSGQLVTKTYINLKWAGKKRQIKYNYGIHTAWSQSISWNAIINRSIRNRDSLIRQPKSEDVFTANKYDAFAQLDTKLFKSGAVSIGMSLGYGGEKMISPNSIRHHSAGLINSFFEYKYRISEFRSIAARLETANAQPDCQLFYGAGFLSGNAVVADGASVIDIIKTSEVSVSYISNNLFSNSHFLINGTIIHSSGAYHTGYYLTPAFSKTSIKPSDNNLQAMININTEKYYAGLQSKVAVLVQVMQLRRNFLLNEAPNSNISTSVRAQVKYLTAFRLPLNLELSFTGTYLGNTISAKPGGTDRQQVWQYEGYGKLKINGSKKVYSNILYALYLPGSGTICNSVDAYLVYRTEKQCTFSLIAHNLLNGKTLAQRNISSNTVQESSFYLVERYLLGKIAFSF